MTDETSKKIPSPLGELRRSKGLKVEDIQKYFKSQGKRISTNAIYWWEEGEKVPRPHNKALYAASLGITAEELDKLLKEVKEVKRNRMKQRGVLIELDPE